MAYTVAPFPYHAFYDDDGAPAAGFFLYSYAAGTTTPQDTYSSSDSVTPVVNTNPVELDAYGRAKIFLAALSYKFILKTAAGAEVWTIDGIQSTAIAAANATDISICNGRMTLTSATPVTTADVTAATTVYFTPYKGNRIALYDGTTWNVRTFAELSLSLGSDAADKNYDLFAYDDAGTATLERLVWTNDSTRATALVSQDGVLVKSGAVTRRYLGTYRTTATIGQTEDSLVKRFVWNYTHRAPRTLRRNETTDTWAYSTTTWQQANAAVANQLAFVVGVAEVPVHIEVRALARNDTIGNRTAVGIGKDNVTAPFAGSVQTFNYVPVTNYIVAAGAVVDDLPAAGYHYYAWLEYGGASGTTTWIGDNGDATLQQSGIHGLLFG